MLTSLLVRSTRPAGPLIGNVLMLGVALVAAALSSGSTARGEPIPIVAYGNLGNAGTLGLTTTSTTTGSGETSTKSLAAGFTTGTDIQSLFILTVTLGLAAPVENPGVRTVGIYANSGGAPGDLLYTSSNVSVSTKGKYAFQFGWAELDPSTSYWIQPSDPILWYTAEFDGVPQGRNSSGYSYLGTARFGAGEEGEAWYSSGTQSYAVSVVAVPEPGTIPLAGLGIATVAWACRRRRRRAAAGV